MKQYAVMLFETELHEGISQNPNRWVNTKNYVTDNPYQALTLYSEIRCPASQFIEAEDEYELRCKMGEMMHNFADVQWVNENIYQYI